MASFSENIKRLTSTFRVRITGPILCYRSTLAVYSTASSISHFEPWKSLLVVKEGVFWKPTHLLWSLSEYKIVHVQIICYWQGRPSPLRQWCIFPCFRFPPIPHIFEKYFGLRDKLFRFHLVPPKFPIFIRQNFWWPFLVTDHRFWISPSIFAVSVHFPLFRENIISPSTFPNFPLISYNLRVFTYFMCFSFPP